MNDLVQKLMRSKNYRGQVFRSETHTARSCETSDFDIPPHLNTEIQYFLETDSFQPHQIGILKDILANESSFLFSEFDDNEDKTLFIAILNYVVRRGQTVLAILPEQLVQSKGQKFKDWLETTKFHSVVNSRIADRFTTINEAIHSRTDVIFTSAETILESLRTTHLQLAFQPFFESLGLLLVEKVDEYRPQELIHIKYLVRILQMMVIETPVFLISGRCLRSMGAFVENLTGSDTQTRMHRTSHIGLSSYTTLFWVPPILKKDPQLRELERNTAENELDYLVQELANNGIRRLLIWQNAEPVSIEDLEYRKEYWEKSVQHKLRINCVSTIPHNLDESPSYDAIVLSGYPVGFGRIDSILGRLLGKDGIAIILPAENPISYGVLRDDPQFRLEMQDDLSHELMYREVLVPENEDLAASYFALGLYQLSHCSPSRISLEKLERIWGKASVVREVERLKNHGILRVETDYIHILEKEQLNDLVATSNIVWGSISRQRRHIENYGDIDEALAAHIAFEGAILFQDGSRMQFERDGASVSLVETIRGSVGVTVPCREVAFTSETSLHKTNYENSAVSFELIEIDDASISVTGYYPYASNNLNDRGDLVSFEPVLEYKENGLHAIAISSSDAHSFLHFWLIYVEAIVQDLDYILFPHLSENRLLLVALTQDYNNLVDDLYHNLSSLIASALSVAIPTFLAQPQYAPTSTCFLTIKCPYCASRKLDENTKSVLIQDLVTNKTDLQILTTMMEFKKSGLSDKRTVQIKYEQWRDRILRILEDKFQLAINNPVRISAVDQDALKVGAGTAAGMFNGKLVMVNASFNESSAAEVIGHEYTHNWQYEDNMCRDLVGPGVPIGGDLLVEGFAEWVAYKLCDFLGLKDKMNGFDPLRIDFGVSMLDGADPSAKRGNEYSWGFKLLYWLEENISGFQGVIDFIKNGTVTDPADGTKYDLDALLKKSQWEKQIRNAESAWD